MLHIDLPSTAELRQLADAPETPTISVYLPTTPVTVEADEARIAFVNLAREGVEALRSADLFDRGEEIAITEQIDDLADDTSFWDNQAYGLTVIITVAGTVTFRLPDSVGPAVYTGTRPRLTPLVAVATVPRAFLVLDISADGARLLESTGEGETVVIRVPDMPRSAADYAGKTSINDRSHSGRLVGDEGRNVHLRSYARAVNAAVRPLLHGHSEPLVLVGTDPLATMFREVNTYPNLLDTGVALSADHEDDAAVVRLAAPVAAEAAVAKTARLIELLSERQEAGRAAFDRSLVARAAVQGAVDTLLLDTSALLPGSVNEDGSLSEEGDAGGIADDLVRLVLTAGGTVHHVDADQLPGGNPVAAILRWAA